MTALVWLRGWLVPARRASGVNEGGDLEDLLVAEIESRHAAEARIVDKLANFERRLMLIEQYLADVNRKRGIR